MNKSKNVKSRDLENLSDLAYKQLEEMIVTLQLPPGEVLSESYLSTRLNIGRTPIREALKRLSFEGLVVVMPRRGVVVSDISVKAQLQLLEVRRELEKVIAVRATKRSSEAQKQQFLDLANSMDLASIEEDYIGFLRIDSEFKQLLNVCSKNPFATKSVASLRSISRRFWYQYRSVEQAHIKKTAMIYSDIMRAVASGDEKMAEQTTLIHMDQLDSFARATIDI